ncbi:Wzz/FepE/Etk N-terminal domain-containing protein [Fodinibius halophilus]|uniref:Polysaccharide chain length determinant N-terminal domain-containing protein n=1 Tax=Fodinibius halophilus TaxID=1736908 RepID=A0A6M1TIB8_9BACT|nr:Wzz/FepE/Etk N-terminal domain-containing protein [Fodinibius halophilus]NGP88340.1 hypothetical protein [Fodinibius halophilus]
MLVPAEEYEQFRAWSESEIDIEEILSFLWDKRWFITKITGAAAVLGLIVSLLMGSMYTSSASLMPEYSTESSGGSVQGLIEQYGGMLGMGGGTYASNSNAIRVELYPQIVESLPFQLELVEKEYYFPEHDTTATLRTYFDELYQPSAWQYITGYTIGLPFTVKEWITESMRSESTTQKQVTTPTGSTEVLHISKEKMELIEWMRQQVSASLNDETAVIEVQATMPTAQLSADVAKATISQLTGDVTAYRTEKIKTDLAYMKEQHQKAQNRFYAIRDSLAIFRDNNRNLSTARAQTEEQRLQSKYDLAYNLYNGLSQQLEQTKLKLQEHTPVFKTLDPVQVPLEKSSPNRPLIVIMLMFLGAFGVVGYLFIREWMEDSVLLDG